MSVLAGSSSPLLDPSQMSPGPPCREQPGRRQQHVPTAPLLRQAPRQTPSRHLVTGAPAGSTGRELRELTYLYRIKIAPDGRPFQAGPALTRPSTVAAALAMLLAHEAIEVFGILCLTTRRQVICWHEVSRGSLDATSVHPREVFKAAIVANAAAIVIGHNHPSGDPTPSFVDLALTARLIDAGRLLGLCVLDHVIIGHRNFVSLRATRLVTFHSDSRAGMGPWLCWRDPVV